MAGSTGGSDSKASGSEGDDIYEHGKGKTSVSNAEGRAVGEMGSPCRDPNMRPIHFYIDVPDGVESTYAPSERNIPIDPEFQAQLQ